VVMVGVDVVMVVVVEGEVVEVEVVDEKYLMEVEVEVVEEDWLMNAHVRFGTHHPQDRDHQFREISFRWIGQDPRMT